MNKKIFALLLVTGLAMVGCDGGTYDKPRLVNRALESNYICVDGFTYFTYSHAAVPVFDREDRLPKRCK